MITKITNENKKLLTTTLLLIALAITISFTISDASAATINVGSGPGNDTTTIQGAVDLAGTNDIINVHANGSGTYNENVSITKSNLTLQAAQGENVQVSTQNLNKPIISIQGTFTTPVQYVTVSGFNIIGNINLNYSLLKLENANYCTITNNTFTNLKSTTASVEVLYISNNHTIANNTITGGSFGIYKNGANPSNGNKYINNNISNSKTGITITGASNTTISNNNILLPEISGATGIFLGIDTVANQINVISNNIVTKALKTTNATTGIYVSGGGSSITNNQIYSNDVTNLLQGFYIGVGTTSNWSNAIYLNRIYNNTYGLKILSIGTLSSLNATNNWWGKNTAPTIFIGTVAPPTNDIWLLFTGGTTNGILSYDPWLVLNAAANPTSIFTGENSTITADLTKNSNGQDTTTIYPGKFVPNGIPVTFVPDLLGTVNPVNTNITNGTANTTFTAGSVPGISTIKALVDGMDGSTPAKTVSAQVTINQIPTAAISLSKEWRSELDGASIGTANYLDNVWTVFRVQNDGPDLAIVNVSDILPSGFTAGNYWMWKYDTGNWNNYTSAWTGTWSPWVPAYNSVWFAIPGQITVSNTTLNNTVNETGQTDVNGQYSYNPLYPDGPPFGSASALLNVPAAADISVTKYAIDGPSPTNTWNYNSSYYYRIWVSNNGPDNATGVTVTDVLPDGVVFDHANTNGLGTYTYDSLTRTVTWIIGNLANGTGGAFDIFVNVTGHNTNITNNATGNATEYDVNPSNNIGSWTVEVPAAVDMEMHKTVYYNSSGTWDYGKQYAFYVDVYNAGPDTATNVSVVDTLPIGLEFDHIYTYGVPVVSIWDPTLRTITWTFASIGPGVTRICDLFVNVTGHNTTLINNASVNSTEYDWNTANNNGNAAVNIPPAVDIAVNKTITDLTSNSGLNYHDGVLFTVTAKNNGPDNATGVIVTDYLPSGFNYLFALPSKGTFSVLNNVVTWTVGTLNNGQTATLWITGMINGTGWFTNNANLTNVNQYDWNSSNNNTSLPFYVNPAADIAVTKSYNNGQTINYHDYIDFTITATNNGPDDATGVTIRESLPSGIIFDHATGGSYNSATGIWTIGNLAAGTSTTLHIIAYVNDTGLKDNVVRVNSADQYDWRTSNNRDDCWFTIPSAADLSVTKSVNDNTPVIGQTLDYTITVRNNGPDRAFGVTVQDTIPLGFTYVSNDQGATWNPTTRVLTWNVGGVLGLGSGSTRTMHVYVTVDSHPQVPSITNTANVTGSRYDWNTTNNNASVTVTMPAATIDVDKEWRNTLTETTTMANYLNWVYAVVEVENEGPDTATGVTIQDLLPNGFTYAGIYNISYDDGATWNPMDGSFNGNVWTINSLPSGAEWLLAIFGQITTSNTNITNTATQTDQNEYHPDPYDSGSATLEIPSAAFIELEKEWRAILTGTAITTAHYHDLVYAVIHAENEGPDAATGVTIQDLLPSGFTYTGIYNVSFDDGATWQAMDGSFNGTVWTINNIASGLEYLLAIQGNITHTGNITNTANQTAQNEYPYEAFETANATLEVPAQSDVYVQTSASKTNLTVGENLTITVKVGNLGPDTATGVVVSYIVPNGFQYIGTTVDTGTYTYDPATRTITWNIGDVPVGDPYMYVTLKALQSGSFDNTARIVNETTYDPHPDNKSSSVTVTVNNPEVHAASNTVPMQNTGLPLVGLVLAVLLLTLGYIKPKK